MILLRICSFILMIYFLFFLLDKNGLEYGNLLIPTILVLFIFTFLNYINKYVKKIKLLFFEMVFRDGHDGLFSEIMSELLNKNFPNFSKKSKKIFIQRVNNWMSAFNKKLKKENIDIEKTAVLNNEEFLIVLNKALEIVGIKNDEFLNNLLIDYLILRLKNKNLIRDIDNIIIHCVEYLSENHLKFICLVGLLENIKKYFPNIDNISQFRNIVLQVLNLFLINDYSCYEDLKKIGFISNSGNLQFSYPNSENIKSIISSNIGGKLKRLPSPCLTLFDFFKQNYQFLHNITEEEKSLIEYDTTFQHLNKIFSSYIWPTCILKIGKVAMESYFKEKMSWFILDK